MTPLLTLDRFRDTLALAITHLPAWEAKTVAYVLAEFEVDAPALFAEMQMAVAAEQARCIAIDEANEDFPDLTPDERAAERARDARVSARMREILARLRGA